MHTFPYLCCIAQNKYCSLGFSKTCKSNLQRQNNSNEGLKSYTQHNVCEVNCGVLGTFGGEGCSVGSEAVWSLLSRRLTKVDPGC